MDSPELQDLIARAQKHEQSAFGELYDMYAQRIYRFISFKIATREQAEDILQETFLKAWQALPKLKLEKLYFSAWLYTIARNLVNDHYRTLKRRPTPDDIENYYDLTDNDDPLGDPVTTGQLLLSDESDSSNGIHTCNPFLAPISQNTQE
jgi:RNA polymerase sigma factor (sigma-70 family)